MHSITDMLPCPRRGLYAGFMSELCILTRLQRCVTNDSIQFIESKTRLVLFAFFNLNWLCLQLALVEANIKFLFLTDV